MDIQDFITNFGDVLETTDPATITPATVIRDLEEWSSLMALSIIGMVDEAYDITLKGDDIRNSKTVQDLYDAVAAKA